jgi:hypothetical protein
VFNKRTLKDIIIISWSFTLREECRLRVFENKVDGRIILKWIFDRLGGGT